MHMDLLINLIIKLVRIVKSKIVVDLINKDVDHQINKVAVQQINHR